MKPVETPAESSDGIPETVAAGAVVAASTEPEFVETVYDEPAAEESVEAGHIDEGDIEVEEPDEEEIPVTVAVPAAAAGAVFATHAMAADEARPMTVTPEALDDAYHITVIEETNGKQRNGLLMASAVFCVMVALAATVYSLFDKDLGVGAIDDGNLFSAVIVDEPMTVEEEKIQKEEKDKGGGGGGGGREEQEETSQGDLDDQSKNPTRPPDVKVPRMDNFELVTPPPQTEGDRKFAKNFDRWGDPNSKFAGLSNGTGSGGGQGSGVGTGQGSGRGTGTGSGTGSGSGSGNGDGNGDGDGSGGNSGGGPPPKAVAAVTSPLKIISKPRPGYTDAARTNNVQGSVRLKVTFLASGAIGSVTPVTRLPHGLTEQAIAAAKQIRFEPKKINGVAQSVVVTVDYGFNIY